MPAFSAIASESPVRAAETLLRWPRAVPLAALVSGGEERAHNGWSIFARPCETVVIDGGLAPEEAEARLEAALARTPREPQGGLHGTGVCTPARDHGTGMRGPDGASRTPPFQGGWIVALGYSLGACLEPGALPRRQASPTPHAVLLWCEDAWCLDHSDGSLHAVGSPPALEAHAPALPWSLDRFEPDTSDSHYAAAVEQVIEFIRAGDAFQANIARRFSAGFAGDPRTFAHRAITENRAWFGAFLDFGALGQVVSISPELFLRVGPDGTVVTRPIKGTRPSSVDRAELEGSAKDAAELAMIVDLMRNDLGRVAETGSVRVTSARVLETHRTVHHGVAEIAARLRDDVSWLDLLRATFPPGSVTGAPKIRAMQIIDELEPHARGFYCGAIGFISRSGHAALNVAIRTALLDPAARDGRQCLSYFAGCGIVADSNPFSEVAETHAKAHAVAQLAGQR